MKSRLLFLLNILFVGFIAILLISVFGMGAMANGMGNLVIGTSLIGGLLATVAYFIIRSLINRYVK